MTNKAVAQAAAFPLVVRYLPNSNTRFPVAVITPQLAEAPVIDPQSGMLRVKGTFPGQPVKIDFEVLYQPVAGRWRIFGLAVNPTSAAPATADAAKQVPQPPAKVITGSAPAGPPVKKAEPAKAEPLKK